MKNTTSKRKCSTDFVEKSEKNLLRAELKDKLSAALANNKELELEVSKLRKNATICHLRRCLKKKSIVKFLVFQLMIHNFLFKC